MNLFVLIYVVIGAFVAAAERYFSHVGSLEGVLEAIVAILIWPLILLGVQVQF